MKYIDLITYPIMLFVVYVLIGLLNWDKDPATWAYAHRCIWVTWGLVWGFALQRRVARGGMLW
jgi:hypothetical protein